MSLLQVTSCGRQIDLAIAQNFSITLEDSGIGDSIAIPVCDGSLTVTAEDFSPQSLFRFGEQGVWYDPSDFSTMFQDSAGTTPVTATGQAVGRILDKSGRGNHATQATPTSRPILQQDASGRYYLNFDGTDDSLFTGSLNFSGGDKLTVWAGVRKNADASTACFYEFSANINTNAGAFIAITNPSAYSFSSRGSAAPFFAATPASYAAPITNVFTQIGDISGDLSRMRVNGATVVTSATDQGTGNYGTYAMHIGRRNNTNLPLNGRIYGLIVRRAASSDGQITNAEMWMNGKTGAY